VLQAKLTAILWTEAGLVNGASGVAARVYVLST